MTTAVRILLCGAALATVAHGMFTVFGVGKPGLNDIFNEWLYDGVIVAAALACLLRGILVRDDRAAWLMIAAGVWLWAIGDIYWNFKLAKLDEIPYPSARRFLLHQRVSRVLRRPRDAHARAPEPVREERLARWADRCARGRGDRGRVPVSGLRGQHRGRRGDGRGQPRLPARRSAARVVRGRGRRPQRMAPRPELGSARRRPGRWWRSPMASTFSRRRPSATRPGRGPTLSGSSAAMAIAAAGWTLGGRARPAASATRRMLALPALFALAGVGMLLYDHFERVSDLAIWLAGASLLLVVVRMVLAFEENLMLLRQSQSEALTDPLTGLGNRRRLLRDLERVTGEAESGQRQLVAIFDLDGFKSYNDSFGHLAGDVLLSRLGHKLAAAVEPHGVAYRLGGDEFCVLAMLDRAIARGACRGRVRSRFAKTVRRSRSAARAAPCCFPRRPTLAATPCGSRTAGCTPEGNPPAFGRAPDDGGADANAARARAGARNASRGRGAAGGRARSLSRAGRRGDGRRRARAPSCTTSARWPCRTQILHKPGPLNDREWEVIRTHTLIGERILASAPALVPVAKLVRSSHERWDGGGYPDGLAGEEIPLGARIIAVCDAYEAMVEDRPWRTLQGARRRRSPSCATAPGRSSTRGLVDIFCRRFFCEIGASRFATPASASL